MKNLLKSICFFAIALMACVNLSSCSSNSDDNGVEESISIQAVLGKWRVEKIDFLSPTMPIEDVAYGSGFQRIKLTSDGKIEF